MFKKLLAFLILFPASVIASTTSEIEQITASGANNGSGFIIKFKTSLDVSGASSCQSKYHYLDASTEKGKMIFTMLLSARMANTPVNIQFDSAGCSGGRGIISGVTL